MFLLIVMAFATALEIAEMHEKADKNIIEDTLYPPVC